MEKEEQKYTVALEIGTSKMVGIIGRREADGFVTVEAIEVESSANSIKRGCIQNVEEAAIRIKKLINKLSNRIPDYNIDKIYVGIAGQSLHTVSHTVSRDLPQECAISQEHINSLLQEANSYPLPQGEILNIVPNEYLIDKRQEQNPVGVLGTEIEMRLKLVVARLSLKRKLHLSIAEKAKVTIAGYITSPLATANVVLTSEDKQLGCCLIDFGAGTTTLSIYKDSVLRHLVTIPFGGRNITSDICSLNILEENAEQIKRLFGKTTSAETPNLQPHEVEELEQHRIKYDTLCRVVEARIEEIVANIVAQLTELGYKSQLPAGIVITGGASQLKGLPELLEHETELKVRKGNLSQNIALASKSMMITPDLIQAVGLIFACPEVCTSKRIVEVVTPPPPPLPPTPVVEEKPGSIFSQIKERFKRQTESFLNEGE